MTTITVAKLGPPVRNSDGRMAIPVTATGVLTKEMAQSALRSLCEADVPSPVPTPLDCKHGGKHGPWTTTYMGASCDACGYFTQD